MALQQPPPQQQSPQVVLVEMGAPQAAAVWSAQPQPMSTWRCGRAAATTCGITRGLVFCATVPHPGVTSDIVCEEQAAVFIPDL